MELISTLMDNAENSGSMQEGVTLLWCACFSPFLAVLTNNIVHYEWALDP